jgi:uncharacterized membrane protein YesL
MEQARLLRVALVGNALFSALSGGVMIVASGLVTDTLGWTGPELWPFIGAGLWIFAADLLWQARRARPVPWQALLSSVGDGCWVVATVGLALTYPSLMNATGWGLAAAVAVIVALFGFLQLGGLDRLNRAPAAG